MVREQLLTTGRLILRKRKRGAWVWHFWDERGVWGLRKGNGGSSLFVCYKCVYPAVLISILGAYGSNGVCDEKSLYPLI